MIFLALLSLLPFLRAIHGEFLFDDPLLFEFSPGERNGLRNPIMSDFRMFFRAPRALTQMIDNWLFQIFGVGNGLDAIETAIVQPSWPWHTANLLLHLGSVLSLYALLQPTSTPERAFLAAAVFAVHPLQVQSVSYVSGRAAVQTTFFTFLGILHASMGGWHWGFAVLSQLFAVKSKQDGFLYVIFYGVYFLCRI